MARQDAIKRENVRAVLNVLRRVGQTSRVDIARATGLQPSTVSNLVRELIADRWVVETGRGTPGTGGGKPTTLIRIDPHRGTFLAFFWTARDLEGALYDCGGMRVATARTRFVSDGNAGLAFVRCAVPLVRRLLRKSGTVQKSGTEAPLLGVGLAVSSVVDQTGAIRVSDGFPYALDDAEETLRDVVKNATIADREDGGTPAPSGPVVVVENDANCIAIGVGQENEAAQVLAVVFSADPPSVGAGLLTGDTLWRGVHGSAGELLAKDGARTVEDLDRHGSTAVRFADPGSLVVGLTDGISWGSLHETRRAAEEAGITVALVNYRDEVLRGAAYLAYRSRLESYLAGEDGI